MITPAERPRIEAMWVVHLMLTLAALYAASSRGCFSLRPGSCFRPCSPERRGFSFPHQLRVSRSGRPTAKALPGCESRLRERRPMPRRRAGAVLGQPHDFRPSGANASRRALHSGRLQHRRAAVAAYLARHRPVAEMILVTPFDSLEAAARDLYWWAPVGLLLRNRMPTIEFVRGSLVPTALIIAERDAIVPARRSAPLRTAIRNLVFERAIDAGHNDIYDHPEFAV